MGGDCLKRGAWTVSRFKRGLARKRVWFFLSGVDTPMHTMHNFYVFWLKTYSEITPERNFLQMRYLANCFRVGKSWL